MSSNFHNHYIEGEKIYLREIRTDDVNENYYRWMNDEEITAYTESRFKPQSIEQLKEYVAKIYGDSNSIFLAIIDKDTDKHIGNIKLGNINWIHRFGDIGIIIGEKSFWGKGYGSEAIKLLTVYSFNKLNLHRIWAGCYELNKGSIAAFKKIGFKEEGILRKQYFYNGKYIDGVILGITNEDFQYIGGN